RRVIAAIRRRLGGGRRVVVVPAAPGEPRGLRALASLGRAMTDGLAPGAEPFAIRREPTALGPQPSTRAQTFSTPKGARTLALGATASAFRASLRSTTGLGSKLMNLAPPGIDELFGVLSVVEAGAGYDLIVVDTAPTGHALRLLEMPDAAREWVQVLLRVLLKYRQLIRPGQLASELVQLSKSIRALREQLHDPAAPRSVVVTRGAALPRLEPAALPVRRG